MGSSRLGWGTHPRDWWETNRSNGGRGKGMTQVRPGIHRKTGTDPERNRPQDPGENQDLGRSTGMALSYDCSFELRRESWGESWAGMRSS